MIKEQPKRERRPRIAKGLLILSTRLKKPTVFYKHTTIIVCFRPVSYTRVRRVLIDQPHPSLV
jgi:hypothetical protein